MYFGRRNKGIVKRLVDIIWLMRKYSIEPKYLQFVHPYPRKKANLILIKGARQGRVFQRNRQYLRQRGKEH